MPFGPERLKGLNRATNKKVALRPCSIPAANLASGRWIVPPAAILCACHPDRRGMVFPQAIQPFPGRTGMVLANRTAGFQATLHPGIAALPTRSALLCVVPVACDYGNDVAHRGSLVNGTVGRLEIGRPTSALTSRLSRESRSQRSTDAPRNLDARLRRRNRLWPGRPTPCYKTEGSYLTCSH